MLIVLVASRRIYATDAKDDFIPTEEVIFQIENLENQACLIWQNADIKNRTEDWRSALDHTHALNEKEGFAGHKDWRLPILLELKNMQISPALSPNYSGTFWIWSGDTDGGDAWQYQLNTNTAVKRNKQDGAYVRAVSGPHKRDDCCRYGDDLRKEALDDPWKGEDKKEVIKKLCLSIRLLEKCRNSAFFSKLKDFAGNAIRSFEENCP